VAVPRRAAPATLTEWLRSRSDDDLASLLRRRPDLALPAPSDFATLASRVSVRTSVQRAVDALDGLSLAVLEALVLAEEPSVPPAADLLPDLDRADLLRGLDELRAVGLVWGEDEDLHLAATVAEAVGPYPAGLGRPAGSLLRACSDATLAPVLRELGLPPTAQPRSAALIAEVLADPGRVLALLAECTPAERDVLDRLVAGPPVGVLRAQSASLLRSVPGPSPEQISPAQRLVRRGLLVALDGLTVELPREVGLVLRGRTPLGPVHPRAPEISVVERTAAEADRLGTTAVLETVRRIAALAEVWTAQPAAVLRSGGLGVRDLRRTARAVGVDEPTAALLVETASAASLISTTTGFDPAFLPTAEFDSWRRLPVAQRWSALAAAWLSMTRQPALVGQRGDRDRVVTALSPDGERGTMPALRAAVLELLAQLPPGSAPRQRGDVLDRLAWQAPRRAASQRPMAEAVLAEADILGLTAGGGLTSYGRALLADGSGGSSGGRGTGGFRSPGGTAEAERALSAALPEPVDHILLQPDLTAVVPGPPAEDLAAELAPVADLESSGGASVYRITEATIRRALDSGRTGDELARLFNQRSRTPVPQALSYLIDDVARRYGQLRSGAAAAYLRCDDETLLSGVLAETSVEALGLRRIAPTVAISPVPAARLLDVLRAAGYAPAAESPDGTLLTRDEDPPRAPSPPPVRYARARSAIQEPAQLVELVRRIRSGDALAQLSRRLQPTAQRVPGVTSATTLGLLREAIRHSRAVWLGYVDADGTASQHTILPISLGGGVLRGHEGTNRALRAFPLHRITAVSVLHGADADVAATVLGSEVERGGLGVDGLDDDALDGGFDPGIVDANSLDPDALDSEAFDPDALDVAQTDGD
jgi:Helicase conserved C-terminal domain